MFGKKKTAKKNVSLYEDEVFYVKDDKKVEEEKNDEKSLSYEKLSLEMISRIYRASESNRHQHDRDSILTNILEYFVNNPREERKETVASLAYTRENMLAILNEAVSKKMKQDYSQFETSGKYTFMFDYNKHSKEHNEEAKIADILDILNVMLLSMTKYYMKENEMGKLFSPDLKYTEVYTEYFDNSIHSSFMNFTVMTFIQDILYIFMVNLSDKGSFMTAIEKYFDLYFSIVSGKCTENPLLEKILTLYFKKE